MKEVLIELQDWLTVIFGTRYILQIKLYINRVHMCFFLALSLPAGRYDPFPAPPVAHLNCVIRLHPKTVIHSSHPEYSAW